MFRTFYLLLSESKNWKELQKQTFRKTSQKNYKDIKYKSLNKDRQVILLKFYYFLAPGHYENFRVKPPLHEQTDLIRLTWLIC